MRFMIKSAERARTKVQVRTGWRSEARRHHPTAARYRTPRPSPSSHDGKHVLCDMSPHPRVTSFGKRTKWNETSWRIKQWT